MKSSALIVPALFLFSGLFAQVNITPEDYATLKSNGLLDPATNYHIQLPPAQGNGPVNTDNSRISGCQCYTPPDNSYTVAMAPNDDGSTGLIAIPFDFCLYGQTWNSLYINNNGNVSFGSAYSTFSSNPFPSASFTMVAPFWGDVDTRSNGGTVYYKITPTAVYVNWEAVGYFNQHNDKRNTFQLIITDGNDPVIGVGNNVAFCYQDMQWTTGDASQGVNGFGGIPATVGANRGNGVDFVQFGRFDSPGVQYFGPFANNSQVSWLDYQSFAFNVCNATNIPPIASSDIGLCDTIFVCEGDTIVQTIDFLSPESGQITTINVSSSSSGFSVLNQSNGNTATVTFQLIGSVNNLGSNIVTVTATDDGVPSQSVTYNFNFFVSTFPLPYPDITGPSPICSGDTALLDAGPNFDTYAWSITNGTNQTTNATQAGQYVVTVTRQGCTATDTFDLVLNPVPSPVIMGDTAICETGQATLTVAGGQYYSYNWSNGASSPSIQTGAGIYTVSVTNEFGCSSISPPFEVQVLPLTVSISGDQSICEGTTTQLSVPNNFVQYNWSTGGTTNTVTVGDEGLVTVEVTDANNCTASDSVFVNVNLLAVVTVDNLGVCAGSDLTITTTPVQGSPVSYTWNIGNGFITSGSGSPVINIVQPGVYPVQLALVSDSNCINIITDTLYVYDPPVPDFSSNLGCFLRVDFQDSSVINETMGTWLWELGDTTVTQDGQSQPFSYQFPGEGNFPVTLTLTDIHNCSNTITKYLEVVIKEELPNVPNIVVQHSTEGNDVMNFDLSSPGFNQCYGYTMTIFNRWGMKVFETVNNPNVPDPNCDKCFKGQTSDGVYLQPGVYFILIKGDHNYEYNNTLTITAVAQ